MTVRRRPHVPPRWRVRIGEHTVLGRDVPRLSLVVRAFSADDAARIAAQRLHDDIGLPLGRDALAETLLHAEVLPR